MMFKLSVCIASVAGALALATPALAANGHGGGGSAGSSSISLVVLSPAGAAGSLTTSPSYGDQVTFDVSTTETAYPYVNLLCYQGRTLVAEGWAGFFDGALGTGTFTLWSPSWLGGAADCTANLDVNSGGRWKVLASTGFHVGA